MREKFFEKTILWSIKLIFKLKNNNLKCLIFQKEKVKNNTIGDDNKEINLD